LPAVKKKKQNVWQIFLPKIRNKFLTDILRKTFWQNFLTKNQKQFFDKYIRKTFGNQKLLANTFGKKLLADFCKKLLKPKNILKQKITKN
jgi:hypothetical protein